MADFMAKPKPSSEEDKRLVAALQREAAETGIDLKFVKAKHVGKSVFLDMTYAPKKGHLR